MKKGIIPLLSIVALATMASAAAGQKQAPSPVKFDVFAGVALPHGDGSDVMKTGYTVGGGLDVRDPKTPFGLRAELLYSGLDMKDSNGAVDQGMTDFGGNGNAVFWIGTGAPVTGYLTGGPSYAHLTYSGTTGQFSGYTIQNHWGVNYGAGIEFPLGSLSTRLDVRYREISMDGGGTFETIPITFGITF